jgi:hypothetical protein
MNPILSEQHHSVDPTVLLVLNEGRGNLMKPSPILPSSRVVISLGEFKKHMKKYMDMAAHQNILITKRGFPYVELTMTGESRVAIWDSFDGIAKGVDAEDAIREGIYRHANIDPSEK